MRQENDKNKNPKPDMDKIAVALQYNTEENAPRVVATGKGYLADKIIETAGESDVPIHEDAKLSKSLSTLTIGDMIPPELYEVVAEVLVFVDRMDNLKRKLDYDKKV
ncbi:EscU/YscU/HrcU family type III secretion system export apparatus switch protein [Konateibacter massiliensis]|uniref:EscU/YscU/HrcU family type III secretion system export apparatus switch protein n=1 Tax=Konateibacter massiliensis TaxID=2002841 RepID=UPI000C14C620|nr:EscU/YscU/HrcU family type III secretion system export apparatus switch protein [Konateibacter massiliensis]